MVYRNVYIKGHNEGKIPASLLRGMKVLRYTGEVHYGVEKVPSSFDSGKDIYITCDCTFSSYHIIKKIF